MRSEAIAVWEILRRLHESVTTAYEASVSEYSMDSAPPKKLSREEAFKQLQRWIYVALEESHHDMEEMRRVHG